MSNVVLVTPYAPPPDGIARHSAQFIAAWEKAGHQVLVLAPRSSHDPRGPVSAGVRVERCLGVASPDAAWRALTAFEPDVLLIQFAVAALHSATYSALRLMERAQRAGIRVVTMFHEPDAEVNALGPVTRAIYRRAVRASSVVVAFSEAGRRALRSHDLAHDVVLVHHGTNGLVPVDDDSVTRVRERYGLDGPSVLTLGFVHRAKGTDVFIEAARLMEQAGRADVRWIVAGSPRQRSGLFRLRGRDDHRFHRELHRDAQHPTLNVQLHDYVDDEDLVALLHAVDVVVLPYRTTTQSGVANLALSSQAVIVASDLPGLREHLGDAAHFVPVDDASAIVVAVSALVGPDGLEQRVRLRAVAGARAQGATYEAVAAELLTLGTDR